MKDTVNVSVVQFDAAWLDRDANARRMAEFVEAEARTHGADLVVFPELANTGYVQDHLRDPDFTRAIYREAEPIPGPTTDLLGEVARRCGTHVILGITQTHAKIPHVLYNSAALVAPDGEVIGVYQKMHAAMEEKDYFAAGGAAEVYQTALGRIALNICYDVRFPELARLQALEEAELIVAVWAMYEQPGKAPSDSIIVRCRQRARENAVYFVGCNRSGRENDRVYFGRSIIAGPDGAVLAISETDQEEVLRGTLTDAALQEHRATVSYLADRRPELYQSLVEPL
jgi:predicted amidohydrolase